MVGPLQFIFGYINDMMPEFGNQLIFFSLFYEGFLRVIGGLVSNVVNGVLGFIPGF